MELVDSTLIDKHEAARILSRGCRTIEGYANQGLLSRVQKGRRVFYLREEVERLLNARERRKTSPSSLLRLDMRVEKLETEVALLLRVHDLRPHSLLTPEELLKRFPAATLALREEKWSIDEGLLWYQVFVGITDEDLRFLQELLEEQEWAGEPAWAVFHFLCSKMIGYFRGHRNFNSRLDLQRTHALLIRARRQLRAQVMLAFGSELEERSRHFEALFSERPTVREDLLSRIS